MSLITKAVGSGESRRHTWMDLYRGFAVVLVAASHSADATTSPAIRAAMAALSEYRIPSLLLLSGLLLPRSLDKPPREFLAGKVRRILWPCLVWSAIMLPIGGFEHALDWRWWLLAEPYHAWYLSALFMFYLLGLATRAVPPLVVAGILLVVSVACQPLMSAGDVPGMLWYRPWYGVFFFLGAALAPRLGAFLRAPAWVVALAVAASVLWSVRNALLADVVHTDVLATAMSVIGILVLVWVAPHVPRIGAVRALEWAGRRSVVIYLVHFPAMFAWHQLGFSADGVADYIVMFLLTLGAAVVAAAVYPWTRWLYEMPRLRRRERTSKR